MMYNQIIVVCKTVEAQGGNKNQDVTARWVPVVENCLLAAQCEHQLLAFYQVTHIAIREAAINGCVIQVCHRSQTLREKVQTQLFPSLSWFVVSLLFCL